MGVAPDVGRSRQPSRSFEVHPLVCDRRRSAPARLPFGVSELPVGCIGRSLLRQPLPLGVCTVETNNIAHQVGMFERIGMHQGCRACFKEDRWQLGRRPD